MEFPLRALMIDKQDTNTFFVMDAKERTIIKTLVPMSRDEILELVDRMNAAAALDLKLAWALLYSATDEQELSASRERVLELIQDAYPQVSDMVQCPECHVIGVLDGECVNCGWGEDQDE